MVTDVPTMQPAAGEILGVSVIIEQAANSADGRRRIDITIVLPDNANLQLRVNGELLLLGDE